MTNIIINDIIIINNINNIIIDEELISITRCDVSQSKSSIRTLNNLKPLKFFYL